MHADLRASLLLLLAWAATIRCSPVCSPTCQPLAGTYDGSAALLLQSGLCYTCTSLTSTSSLPPLASNTTTVWSASAPSQQLSPPVLDLCNQVQNIWVMPGKLTWLNWAGGSTPLRSP